MGKTPKAITFKQKIMLESDYVGLLCLTNCKVFDDTVAAQHPSAAMAMGVK